MSDTVADWRDATDGALPAIKKKKVREKPRRNYFQELQEQKAKADATCKLLERICKEDRPEVLKALAAIAKETLEG